MGKGFAVGVVGIGSGLFIDEVVFVVGMRGAS